MKLTGKGRACISEKALSQALTHLYVPEIFVQLTAFAAFSNRTSW